MNKKVHENYVEAFIYSVLSKIIPINSTCRETPKSEAGPIGKVSGAKIIVLRIKQWVDSMKTSGDVEPSGIKV